MVCDRKLLRSLLRTCVQHVIVVPTFHLTCTDDRSLIVLGLLLNAPNCRWRYAIEVEYHIAIHTTHCLDSDW